MGFHLAKSLHLAKKLEMLEISQNSQNLGTNKLKKNSNNRKIQRQTNMEDPQARLLRNQLKLLRISLKDLLNKLSNRKENLRKQKKKQKKESPSSLVILKSFFKTKMRLMLMQMQVLVNYKRNCKTQLRYKSLDHQRKNSLKMNKKMMNSIIK